ncbi:hypothetical protein FZI91_20625 [Mycobacterium sp. CBMA271]|uniref:hypothetical protein n=1 Tax=unclassified Mycobacteroides TaxID=2618759 RepID=UPI0012DF11F3|nr:MULTISPECIES: hypothetical protein [unclassified Mycobacteroides]MUM24093.1 hypothetical protein [Mycobacteroides sp. CBMA 271]
MANARYGAFFFLCAMGVAMLGGAIAPPAHAAPPPERVTCGALDVARQHIDAAGGEVNNMRTALQSFVVGRNKMQWTNNISIAVNQDVTDMRNDQAAIGDKGFADAVEAFASAVNDMNQSVKGIYHVASDDDGTYLASSIPSPDTYGFVDTAGDKQLEIVAAVNRIRAGGCA